MSTVRRVVTGFGDDRAHTFVRADLTLRRTLDGDLLLTVPLY
jgi:hypothetical protein